MASRWSWSFGRLPCVSEGPFVVVVCVACPQDRRPARCRSRGPSVANEKGVRSGREHLFPSSLPPREVYPDICDAGHTRRTLPSGTCGRDRSLFGSSFMPSSTSCVNSCVDVRVDACAVCVDACEDVCVTCVDVCVDTCVWTRVRCVGTCLDSCGRVCGLLCGRVWTRV